MPPGLLAYDGEDEEKKKKQLKPPSSSLRLPLPILFSTLCFLFGISGILFSAVALLRPRPLPVFRCGRIEDTLRAARKTNENGELDRPKLLGFVGVQTGFGSADRRAALRSTWFPSDTDGLLR